MSYASDSRGCHPYIPVIDGEIVACPQIPTTLPTLDEILAIEPGFTPEQAADRIVQLSLAIPGDHVVTLRAELEGVKFAGLAERMRARRPGSRLHTGLRCVRCAPTSTSPSCRGTPFCSATFLAAPANG